MLVSVRTYGCVRLNDSVRLWVLTLNININISAEVVGQTLTVVPVIASCLEKNMLVILMNELTCNREMNINSNNKDILYLWTIVYDYKFIAFWIQISKKYKKTIKKIANKKVVLRLFLPYFAGFSILRPICKQFLNDSTTLKSSQNLNLII